MIDEEIDKEEESKEEREKKIFSNLRYDYKKAKDAKSTIDQLINEWNDLYYGKKDSDRPEDSKLIIREIAKQIEWMKPNITEPFTSTSNPIRINCAINSGRARVMEKWSNHQFTQDFDRQTFMEQLTDVLLREGTVWVKTGWEYTENIVEQAFPSMSMEELLVKTEELGEPDELNQNEDGTFSVEWKKTKMLTNRPTGDICRNEHVFPDPSARTDKECRFVIQKSYYTISELKKKNWCSEKQLNKLQSSMGQEREDTALGSVRDADARNYGYDTGYQPKDKARRKIAVLEYWGEYDVNGDGIAEQIVARWAERETIDFGIEENPMPSKSIPFYSEVFSSRPFSLWGNSLAYFLGDSQRVKTGIVRGIMNNMANANNGQKFVTRGALDYVNFKRLRNGDRHIIVNKPDSIVDGSYNQLPQSVFQTLELFTRETQELSGVSSGGPALSQGNTSEDNTQQLTMSQQRMASIVRGIENLLGKIVYEWLLMAKVFLDNSQIEQMFTGDEIVDYMSFESASHSHIKMKIGTDVTRNVRIQQINMLMQQSKVLGESLPPEQISNLVAEMYELYDMYEEARALREYKPEPSQEQLQMQQMELQAKQLELQKMQLENAKLQAEIGQITTQGQLNQADAQATVMYKQAQTAEKYAKAEKQSIDTALKPAEVINQMKQNKGNS